MSIKVSAIVPVYNVEKYLDSCISSIINQTLKEIEIILVDDGSPDNCPILCDKYLKIDHRIRVIHKKNEGLGLARNSGLEIASGEFVVFIDSDDIIDKSMLLDLYNKCKIHNLDSCSCCFTRFNETSSNIISEGSNRFTAFDGKERVKDYLFSMIGTKPESKKDSLFTISACKTMYSLKIINQYNLRFLSEKQYASEDAFFNVAFYAHASKVGFTPEGYYHYRVNNNSISQTYPPHKYKAMINCSYLMKDYLAMYFNWNDYEYTYKRFLFRNLKVILKKETLSTNNSNLERIKRIRYCLNEDVFKPLFINYPIGKWAFQQQIYYILAKYNMSVLLYLLIKLARK